MDYPFKRDPREHQLHYFLARRDEEAWGHIWDMGTGKTKEDIDQTSWAFLQGRINGWVIIAPDGVHDNWVADEIPADMPDCVLERARTHVYHASKAGNVSHQEACEALLDHDGLSILAMTYDAVMTGKSRSGSRPWIGGRAFLEKFLRARDAKMTLDESTRIKSAGAKRTRAICALGRRAKMRRIYNGTPVPNGPFDIYPQVKFLDEDFWKERGFANYLAFRTYFGVWDTQVNSTTGKRFEHCVAYRNLHELREMLEGITDRITKEDVLDLPEKVYAPRTFELTRRQRELYDQIKNESIAWLDEDREEAIVADLPIVQLLRLQQISCGYVPRSVEDIEGGDVEPLYEIPGGNPRLDLLRELVLDLPHQAIIWCRFRADVDRVTQMLEREKLTWTRYDGAVDAVDRPASKARFVNGEAQFFVSNPAVGGEGLTLVGAKTAFYYSMGFDLRDREQSEDRCHRIGQDVSPTYVDLIGRGTVDSKIVAALRAKKDVAAQITGDSLREWL